MGENSNFQYPELLIIISIESQPQNLESRNNPENFHPCITRYMVIGLEWFSLYMGMAAILIMYPGPITVILRLFHAKNEQYKHLCGPIGTYVIKYLLFVLFVSIIV